MSPMKLGALHNFCDGNMEASRWLAKLPVRHYCPPPPLGGTGHSDHHDFFARGQSMVTIQPMEGLLDKLI